MAEFVEQLLLVFPCIVASLIVGLDSLTSPFNQDMRFGIRLLAWCVTLFGLYLVRGVLANNRTARFMLLGSVLAVIPHASLLSAGSRSATFVALGFFFVMSLWLKTLWDTRLQQKRRKWWVLAITSWHLFIPALAMAMISAGVATTAQYKDQLVDAVDAVQAAPESSLVVVNPPVPTKLFYLPFEWDYLGRALPDTINALAPGMTSLSLTRVSDRHFLLSSHGQQLALNQDVNLLPPDQYKLMHTVFSYQLLQGLFTSPKQAYSVAESWESGKMRVTPVDLNRGIPETVRIDFYAEESPDQMRWVFYDWKTKAFKPMSPPQVGETYHFDGPFDL